MKKIVQWYLRVDSIGKIENRWDNVHNKVEMYSHKEWIVKYILKWMYTLGNMADGMPSFRFHSPLQNVNFPPSKNWFATFLLDLHSKPHNLKIYACVKRALRTRDITYWLVPSMQGIGRCYFLQLKMSSITKKNLSRRDLC